MGGSGGGQASGISNQTSATDFPEFYKQFLYNQDGQSSGGMFNLLGQQMGQMPGAFNMLQGGGTAPQGGVFNGGAPVSPQISPLYPQGGQMPNGAPVSSPLAPNYNSNTVSTAPLSQLNKSGK